MIKRATERQLFQDRRDWRNPDIPRIWAWGVTDPPPARPAVFSRNPYYWKVDPKGQQLPYIDRITFDFSKLAICNLSIYKISVKSVRFMIEEIASIN